MICQNCNATVDNDLIFCTECGARLHGTSDNPQTVLIPGSVVTKVSATNAPKPKSNLKWVALIIALIAIPVSLLIAYRLFSGSKSVQIAANNEKPANKNSALPVNKQNANTSAQNNSADTNDLTNSNVNAANTGSNEVNSSNPQTADDKFLDEKAPVDKRTEIWSDRIEIAPGENFAVQFSLDGNDRVVGVLNTLQGSPVNGYVYLQTVYDEHFPDPTFKMFSFGEEKTSQVNAKLVQQDYVLVFVNNNKTPSVIKGKFFAVTE